VLALRRNITCLLLGVSLTGCVPLPGNRTLVVGLGLVKTSNDGETIITKKTVIGAEFNSAPFSSAAVGLMTGQIISTSSTNVVVVQ